jgi:hypothetical protein
LLVFIGFGVRLCGYSAKKTHQWGLVDVEVFLSTREGLVVSLFRAFSDGVACLFRKGLVTISGK